MNIIIIIIPILQFRKPRHLEIGVTQLGSCKVRIRTLGFGPRVPAVQFLSLHIVGGNICVRLQCRVAVVFLGVILGVEFLRMGEFSTVEHLCACMRVCEMVPMEVITLYFINCVYGGGREFGRLGERLCFGWGWFVDDAEESATTIPTPLQNDSTEKSVDSECIILISQYHENRI